MKKYTLKELANGDCALENDDTVENLQLVLDKAFPKDNRKLRDIKPIPNDELVAFQSHLSFKNPYDDGCWHPLYKTDTTYLLPFQKWQSCAVFLEEIENSKIKIVSGLGLNIPDEEINGKVEEPKSMREFSTGATRNLSDDKLDFNGFLSPLALEEFAKYMHKNRIQADGKMRDSDNWQRGIEINSYMSSMWRHFFDTWKSHRGLETPEDQISNLCGLLFNVQGMLHELLKTK